MGFKDKISGMFGKGAEGAEYVEIDLGKEARKSKVVVMPFVIKQFEDVNDILNVLREGYTIAVIDIKPLKNKDVIELKRAIAKLKKTADALEGDIMGFGENIVIITPQFAEIHRKRGVASGAAPGENKPSGEKSGFETY